MSSEAAFLSEIRERPDDDSPRLVFADWLDENGDPDRAEFIRVQIEWARTIWPDPNWYTLHDRQQRLWESNHERWLSGLPDACWPNVTFERGFVSSVEA